VTIPDWSDFIVHQKKQESWFVKFFIIFCDAIGIFAVKMIGGNLWWEIPLIFIGVIGLISVNHATNSFLKSVPLLNQKRNIPKNKL
jgi:hypothetical protein